MTQVKPELTARCFATNRKTKAAHSFDRRARLLTASGLVAGVIPTSMRRALGQRTLDFVLSPPAGADVGTQKAV